MAPKDKGKNKKPFRLFNILSALVLLCSCASSSQFAPVHDRPPPASQKLSHHIVSPGETLYSIAWRYGVDYKALARRNGVSSTYTIYPGQKIYLAKQSDRRPIRIKKSLPPKSSVKRSKTTTMSASKSISYSNFRWQWPVKGDLLARFSSRKSLNKGVDIKGRLGESVVAAGPGVVVYAGSGIRGYGNLLIIKHSEKYLSAYAHNNKLFVQEGGVVKAGQKIAEIGNSGTDRNKLHFEIRREGKPVDPLQYLPKR